MNHISILIVDDDFKKITSIIKTIKEVFTETLSISQASCVQEAIENLQKNEYHLLITDLQMPLKFDDTPNDNGGMALVKSLYKKKTNANVPLFIVGLTQFPDLSKDFNSIWKVWHYDASNEEWKINLRDLITHISFVKTRILVEKIETIFVEGPIDKKILEKALKDYFPEQLEKIYIDTINYGGGAAWVERQLFIWAKSLTKNADDKYLKSIGVLDNDEAGNKAIEGIRRDIANDSAEANTFSIIKTGYKYSPILKSIISKGISFPTTIEDLILPKYWGIANEKGWLTNRDPRLFTVDQTILNIDRKNFNWQTLPDFGFTEEETLLVTRKIHDDYKKSFCQLLLESEGDALISIKYLLQDCFEKLKFKEFLLVESKKEVNLEINK